MTNGGKRPIHLTLSNIVSFLILIVPIPFMAAFCQPAEPVPLQTTGTTNEPQATQFLPAGQQGAWNLIFHDEFSGNSLDKTKWNTCYFNYKVDNGCTHDQGELEFYQPGAVHVSNGTARLQADNHPYTASDGKTFQYTSGMITTGPAVDDPKKTLFSFTYGFMEMRAKVPAGKGFWPAFWAIPANLNWPPEIDVFEILGDQPHVVNLHFHYPARNGANGDSAGMWAGPDFTAGWHTYGVDWEPNSITWYVDGVARRTFTNKALIPSQAMYLIANLAVGGSWPGAPNASTHFPATFEIDYVRVWQHSG